LEVSVAVLDVLIDSNPRKRVKSAKLRVTCGLMDQLLALRAFVIEYKLEVVSHPTIIPAALLLDSNESAWPVHLES